jgi:hypothetical protein
MFCSKSFGEKYKFVCLLLEDLNSGFCACWADALPLEPRPQPEKYKIEVKLTH